MVASGEAAGPKWEGGERVAESEKQAPNWCFSGVTWQEMKTHHAGLGQSDRKVGTKFRKGKCLGKQGMQKGQIWHLC